MPSKHPVDVDLTKLLNGPLTRLGLGATAYAVKRGIAQDLIEIDGGYAFHKQHAYKLTKKGRERARRAAKR